jgi:hypothetical protein
MNLSLKGVPTPEIMEKVDKVKKEIIQCVYKPWRFLTLDKHKLYEDITDIDLDVTESANEIAGFILILTGDLRLNIIAEYIIGYDMAYRLRIQDMFNEMDKEEAIKNPRKEIKRLWSIYEKRESVIHTYMLPKSKKVYNLIQIALLFPTIKKRFIYAVQNIDWDRMKFTQDDLEWIKVRQDYKFFI